MTSALQWRMIGLFLGERTVAVCGVLGKQNVFFLAPNNDGEWKSTDYGRAWRVVGTTARLLHGTG